MGRRRASEGGFVIRGSVRLSAERIQVAMRLGASVISYMSRALNEEQCFAWKATLWSRDTAWARSQENVELTQMHVCVTDFMARRRAVRHVGVRALSTGARLS